VTVIELVERSPCLGRNHTAEQDMKIYLLLTLIGTLLTAIHFTSAPKQNTKTLPQ
jgi:hypothetical protein